MDKIREHENLRGCAEDMLIRTEEPGDFDIVRELVRLSFKDMEESDHTEHLLVDRIRRSNAYIPALSLVAEVPGAGVVGHVMLSKVEVVSEKGSVALPGVAPLSVAPGFQRKGIGGRLLLEAHRRAAEAGYSGALLPSIVFKCMFLNMSTGFQGFPSGLSVRIPPCWRPLE